MRMRVSRCLAILTCTSTLLLGFPPSTRAQDEYTGTVINSALLKSPASLHITIRTDDGHQLTGYVAIGAPLGGSGAFQGRRSGDTLYLLTTSGTGDTILWIAPRAERSLIGSYRVVGGPYRSQSGTWAAEPRVFSNAPQQGQVAVEVLDQSDGMVGERLVYFVRESFRRSAAFRLTDTSEPRLQVIITTMPRFKDSPNTSAMYSVVWNLVIGSDASGWTTLYMDNTLGYAGSDVAQGSAEDVVARTDKLLSQVRRLMAGQ